MVEENASLKAVELMKTYNITQLIVKDGASLVGFIHIHDFMKEGIV